MKEGPGTVLRLKENVIVKWPPVVADKEEKGLYSNLQKLYLIKISCKRLYWFFTKNKTHWFLLEKALANLASLAKSSESHPLVNTTLILGCVLPPVLRGSWLFCLLSYLTCFSSGDILSIPKHCVSVAQNSILQ